MDDFASKVGLFAFDACSQPAQDFLLKHCAPPPAPFLGHPLRRQALGRHVDYRAMSQEQDKLLEDSLLEEGARRNRSRLFLLLS